MTRQRPPWRTGEDTGPRVLAWALREAAARPEIVDELAPGAKPAEVLATVTEIVSPVQDTVFAAADEAESRYRVLAGKAAQGMDGVNGLTHFFEDHPLVGELLTCVVIPAVGFATLTLAALPDAPGSVWWPAVVAAAVRVVIGLKILWQGGPAPWHTEFRAAQTWAIMGMLTTVAGGTWLAVELIGWRGVFPAFLTLFSGSFGAAMFPPEWVRNTRRPALNALEEWRHALLREGVLPVLFTRINTTVEQNYSTTLTVRGARELSRANPLSMHVETRASVELDRLIGRLDGGSFALAGPRGAGKSNLLKAFCGGRYRDMKRRPDLAVLESAPVEYVPHEFVLHLFGAVCKATISYVQQLDPDAVNYAARRRRRVLTRIADDLRVTAPNGLADLAVAAHANRMMVRYAQSYTREASAKGGFTGFEVSGRTAVSLERRALTYPELVGRFREFLQDAVAVLEADAARHGRAPGRVLIGIDELDRLAAGDPARRFLNEIKAIFDVSGCYYLVAVSTEAQHDFELSGMGLRSVFDSAFDEVVRVDYFDFAGAKKLLRRYVIGLSEQFMALAYVLSGGLARQLVRTVRTIAEHDGDTLGAVTVTLAGLEVTRTCQTTADALGSTTDRGGITQLLSTVDNPPTKITGAELRAFANGVLAAYQGTSERVEELRDVVGARMHFLATVLDVFTEDLTGDRLTSLGSDVDLLARARRYLGVNPTTGLELIQSYRGNRDQS